MMRQRSSNFVEHSFHLRRCWYITAPFTRVRSTLASFVNGSFLEDQTGIGTKRTVIKRMPNHYPGIPFYEGSCRDCVVILMRWELFVPDGKDFVRAYSSPWVGVVCCLSPLFLKFHDGITSSKRFELASWYGDFL